VWSAAGSFQYPRVGSLPRNIHVCRLSSWRLLTFSIRESDRCLETQHAQPNRQPRFTLSVSASRIVASKLRRPGRHLLLPHPFQYPRVGSLPRNVRGVLAFGYDLFLSVSASRIVASKQRRPWFPQRHPPPFSIRESDRCLETESDATARNTPPKLSVSASRIVASKR